MAMGLALPSGLATALLAATTAMSIAERSERAYRASLAFLSTICSLCLALARLTFPQLLPAVSTAALFSAWLASGASATWQQPDGDSTKAVAAVLAIAASTLLLLAVLDVHPRGSVRAPAALTRPTRFAAAILGSLLSLATFASSVAGAHVARLAQRTEASHIPEVQRDAVSLCVFSACCSGLCQIAVVLAASGSGRTAPDVLIASSVFQMSSCAFGLGASLALASSEASFLAMHIALGAQGLSLVLLSAFAHCSTSDGL